MTLPFTIEPILQWLRIRKVAPHIPLGGDLVDIGCDTPPVLINQYAHKMATCVGVDEVVENESTDTIKFVKASLDTTLPLQDKSADVVTMLAVLEHLKHPKEIVQEVFRVLKPNGVYLLTVPSPNNEPLLNILAKIGLVRSEMIDQHENYFSHDRLDELLKEAGFKNIVIESFELGMNTFARATK